MIETELKFAIHAAFVLDRVDLTSIGVESIEELPMLDLRAAYYDTHDLRLARSGVTIRYRRGEERGPSWDLKLPVAGSDATSREELTFSGPPGKVPDAARDLLTAFARSAPLASVATLRTRRRRWSLKSNGQETAVLFDDEVSVLEGRRVVARFRELELEAVTADRAQLDRIAEHLRDAGAVGAEPIPKVVRALGPQATSPPDVVPGRRCAPEDPASEAIVAALSNAVHRLIIHDPRARVGDPEGVHQMRVAARRMRSDLRTFSSLVEPDWAAGITEELRWIAGLLGGVRDIDVLRHRLRESSGDLADDLKPVWERLDERDGTARTTLLAGMRSDRYRAFLDTLVRATKEPALASDAGRPCGEILPRLVRDCWRKLAKDGRALTVASSDEDFHYVRIRSKRARYAAEAVAPSLGDRSDEAARFAKLAAKVQEVLGEHQDSTIAAALIEAVASDNPDDGAFNLAAGQVLERQRRLAAGARAMFSKVWRKLDRKKKRAWMTT